MKRKTQRNQFVKAAFYFFAFLLPMVLPSSAIAKQLKVMVNHPPQTFFETLKKIDSSELVVLSSSDWFPPSEADVWIVFFSSEKDFATLPRLIGRIVEASKGKVSENSALARMTVHLPKDRDLTVQINNLEGTVHGVDWQGCLAAVDIASLAYANSSIEFETTETACKKYMATANE